jgi:hypothetical protein
MIFQCQASELEKAVATIKNWEAGIDTVPKNLKKINSLILENIPVEVHLSLVGKEDAMTITVIQRGKEDDLSIKIKGFPLDKCFPSSQMTLDDFYFLCKTLPSGKIQINTTPYRVDLYQVEE